MMLHRTPGQVKFLPETAGGAITEVLEIDREICELLARRARYVAAIRSAQVEIAAEGDRRQSSRAIAWGDAG